MDSSTNRGLEICLSNWQVGSSLVAVGLSVWQTMVATIIAKCIISCIAILNGFVGAEWHIGFPVFSRSIWGVYGAYLALVQRILLGLVWFAVQSVCSPKNHDTISIF